MTKQERIALITTLVLLDTLAIGAALALAYYLRIASGLLPYSGPHNLAGYTRMAGMVLPVWLLICAGAQLYDPRLLLGGPQEYGQVVKACTFGVIALITLSFWERGVMLSRGWLLLAWALSIILTGGARFAFRRVIFLLRRRGRFITRALVVGANEQAKAIVRQFHTPEGPGVQVLGFLDDYLPPGTRVMGDPSAGPSTSSGGASGQAPSTGRRGEPFDGAQDRPVEPSGHCLEVLGTPADLERVARETGAGEVIIVPDALAWESFQEIIQQVASTLNDLEVKLSPGFYEILTTGVKVSHKAFVPLLTVERVRITGIDALLKNLLDYGVGAVLLVLTAPLTGLIALILWLVDGHPVLDRHPVLGLGGRLFRTHKFHTGLLGSTRRSLVQPLPAALNNPGHASRLGAFLYRTALDKLPQLFDVLRGRMSLVGPRTISVDSEDRYGPWLPSLLTVKPGITGPWAVSNVPTLDDEVRLTIYYIRNWTIWFDLQILFQTARRLLRPNGPRRIKGIS
jgi:lipopolysaccharide/colanic/teichoic acid biosynthesis glycosyltransferase